MKLSLQMWNNLGLLGSYYQGQGYLDNPQPWVASKIAMEATLPPEVEATNLHGEDLLVGSAEQAFIDRMLDGSLSPGRWQTITPCFRREDKYDELHHPYFMKLELIDYMPGDPNTALSDMLEVVMNGLEQLLNVRLLLSRTAIGWDLNLYGQEVGSYGIRKLGGHHWVYGTGLAEPRFTTLVQMGKGL